MRLGLLLVASTILIGCGVTTPLGTNPFQPLPAPDSGTAVEPVAPEDPVDPGGVVRMGLQYSGAVATTTTSERVDVSAPIFPDTRVLYAHQGAAYPATEAEQVSVARDASMSYEMLLTACAPDYPGITLQTAGGPAPTAEELARNYSLVAQCSYEKFWSKPYWIPQLVDDVEVCSLVLGGDWRLLTQADVAAMSAADFQYLYDTMEGVRQSGDFFGNFYFALRVYVRAADGSLGEASLEPATAGMLANSWGDPLTHNEGATVLRCIRKVAVP